MNTNSTHSSNEELMAKDYNLCHEFLRKNPSFLRKNRDLSIECAPLKAEAENSGLDLVQLEDILSLVAKKSLSLIGEK